MGSCKFFIKKVVDLIVVDLKVTAFDDENALFMVFTIFNLPEQLLQTVYQDTLIRHLLDSGRCASVARRALITFVDVLREQTFIVPSSGSSFTVLAIINFTERHRVLRICIIVRPVAIETRHFAKFRGFLCILLICSVAFRARLLHQRQVTDACLGHPFGRSPV